jgi:tRNA threonylcarbamoyladenosine biosynthesis protein TsaE
MRQPTIELIARDEGATTALGAALAATLPAEVGLQLTLGGELGAGKTTLARGLLAALGVTGPVRSPTYTLVEPYELGNRTVHHLDLYRLEGAEELEALGARDLLAEGSLLVVEWPERAGGYLGAADIACHIEYEGRGRRIRLTAGTPAGDRWLQALRAELEGPESGSLSMA